MDESGEVNRWVPLFFVVFIITVGAHPLSIPREKEERAFLGAFLRTARQGSLAHTPCQRVPTELVPHAMVQDSCLLQ
jgi:hypothetical protein